MAARAEVLVYIHFGVTFGGGACGGLVARRGPPRTGVVGTSAPACLSLLGGVRCDSSGLGLGLVAAADGRHALAAVLARGADLTDCKLNDVTASPAEAEAEAEAPSQPLELAGLSAAPTTLIPLRPN